MAFYGGDDRIAMDTGKYSGISEGSGIIMATAGE